MFPFVWSGCQVLEYVLMWNNVNSTLAWRLLLGAGICSSAVSTLDPACKLVNVQYSCKSWCAFLWEVISEEQAVHAGKAGLDIDALHLDAPLHVFICLHASIWAIISFHYHSELVCFCTLPHLSDHVHVPPSSSPHFFIPASIHPSLDTHPSSQSLIFLRQCPLHPPLFSYPAFTWSWFVSLIRLPPSRHPSALIHLFPIHLLLNALPYWFTLTPFFVSYSSPVSRSSHHFSVASLPPFFPPFCSFFISQERDFFFNVFPNKTTYFSLSSPHLGFGSLATV